MAANLIHKMPCPRSPFAPALGGAFPPCGCPDGWPKYDDQPPFVEDTASIPAGMERITREKFFEMLNADPRDIMPARLDNYDTWRVVATGEAWGWDKDGVYAVKTAKDSAK